VLLEMLGLEHTESPSPVSATEPEKAKECKGKHRKRKLDKNTLNAALMSHKALHVTPSHEVDDWRLHEPIVVSLPCASCQSKAGLCTTFTLWRIETLSSA
jgi:hypothetical protein